MLSLLTQRPQTGRSLSPPYKREDQRNEGLAQCHTANKHPLILPMHWQSACFPPNVYNGQWGLRDIV